MEGKDLGVEIGGTKATNLRHVDDAMLVAGSVQHLGALILKVREESEKAGLFRNIKTAVVATGEAWNIQANNDVLDVVEHYIFLGSIIDDR